jgi:spoIIIJ-associated protein
METVESVIQELLSVIGIPYTDITRGEVAGQTVFTIHADDARPLIGVHGDTIHSIDTLVKKIVEKRSPEQSGAPMHFLVDVNDYRVKHIKELQTKAIMMAERARSFQYDVELSPMSAYERLIIHATLSDAPNIKTESQGEGRERRIVIKYTA